MAFYLFIIFVHLNGDMLNCLRISVLFWELGNLSSKIAFLYFLGAFESRNVYYSRICYILKEFLFLLLSFTVILNCTILFLFEDHLYNFGWMLIVFEFILRVFIRFYQFCLIDLNRYISYPKKGYSSFKLITDIVW